MYNKAPTTGPTARPYVIAIAMKHKQIGYQKVWQGHRGTKHETMKEERVKAESEKRNSETARRPVAPETDIRAKSAYQLQQWVER